MMGERKTEGEEERRRNVERQTGIEGRKYKKRENTKRCKERRENRIKNDRQTLSMK